MNRTGTFKGGDARFGSMDEETSPRRGVDWRWILALVIGLTLISVPLVTILLGVRGG